MVLLTIKEQVEWNCWLLQYPRSWIIMPLWLLSLGKYLCRRNVFACQMAWEWFLVAFFVLFVFVFLPLCFLILETLAFPARRGVIHSSIQNSCKYSNDVSVFNNIKWALNNIKWRHSALQNVALNFNPCTNCILFNYSINTVWHNTLCIYNICIWFSTFASCIWLFYSF